MLNAAQPPAAAIVYVTVYVPTVLVLGLISPVIGLIINPLVDAYAPPVFPINCTDCAAIIVLQNGVFA